MLVLIIKEQEAVTLRVPPSSVEQTVVVKYLQSHYYDGKATRKIRMGFEADRSVDIVRDDAIDKTSKGVKQDGRPG